MQRSSSDETRPGLQCVFFFRETLFILLSLACFRRWRVRLYWHSDDEEQVGRQSDYVLVLVGVCMRMETGDSRG